MLNRSQLWRVIISLFGLICITIISYLEFVWLRIEVTWPDHAGFLALRVTDFYFNCVANSFEHLKKTNKTPTNNWRNVSVIKMHFSLHYFHGGEGALCYIMTNLVLKLATIKKYNWFSLAFVRIKPELNQWRDFRSAGDTWDFFFLKYISEPFNISFCYITNISMWV